MVDISGATGIAYGMRVLELARKAGVETHLVVTSAGEQTRAYETQLSRRSGGDDGRVLPPGRHRGGDHVRILLYRRDDRGAMLGADAVSNRVQQRR